MQDVVEYLNTDAGIAAIGVEEAEGFVFLAQGPVLATPFAVAAATFAGGFVVGRAVG